MLPQAGGTAFALVLLAIFVVSSIAGGGGSPPASSGGAAPELSEQQHKDLQAQAQRFEEQLAASPDSVEALEVRHPARWHVLPVVELLCTQKDGTRARPCAVCSNVLAACRAQR